MIPFDYSWSGARAIAGVGRAGGLLTELVGLFCFSVLFKMMSQDGAGIEGSGRAFHQIDCSFGAIANAGAEAVAIIFADEFGFAVDEFDRSFGAGVGALAATVAEFFVDFDYFS
jgi:hypothetical protein